MLAYLCRKSWVDRCGEVAEGLQHRGLPRFVRSHYQMDVGLAFRHLQAGISKTAVADQVEALNSHRSAFAPGQTRPRVRSRQLDDASVVPLNRSTEQRIFRLVANLRRQRRDETSDFPFHLVLQRVVF